MSTYTNGLELKTERIITKDDIITMCQLLNSRDEYSNLCEFEPEAISEGGILFKFKDNLENANKYKWYKSVRLCVNHMYSRGTWYLINRTNVISEWTGNNDIIFDKDNRFGLYLKSFHGAPIFTVDELKIWEECFSRIGIVNVGKYPTKKSLKTRVMIC